VKVPEIFQVEKPHAPDGLASVLHAIAEAGLMTEHLSTVRRDQDRTLWEITMALRRTYEPTPAPVAGAGEPL
jgi:hypothetical protein